MRRTPRAIDPGLARRRRVIDRLVKLWAISATVAGLFFLAWILATLLWRGLGAMRLDLFTRMTAPPGEPGGLLNAIAGTLIQTTVAMLIAVPIGILAGTYLAEYARHSWLGALVRFVSDILLSAPSILIGLFVYLLVVLPSATFSGWAGALALAIIAIPIMLRATEDMLRLVPAALREAAIGLGAPKWRMITFVGYRAARQGILTGILLAIARLAGEAAPLLFTSLGNPDWSTSLGRPMASLPLAIYQYAGSAFADWIGLAWAGALLITLGVLGLNILARLLVGGGRG